MFQGIFLQVGKPCPRVTEYCSNKRKVRTWLAELTGLPLDDVKRYLNSMHACPEYVWPVHASLEALDWVEGLRLEIRQAYSILEAFSPVFLELLQQAKQRKEKNARGSAVSMFREIQERRCLEALTQYLDLTGSSVCGLIHDAVLLRPGDEECETEQLGREASSFASQRVGYPVSFAIERAWNNKPLPPPKRIEYFPDVTIYEHDRRLRPIVFSENEDVRCLVVNAPMNMGKTFAVREFIASHPHARFLVISTKIVHAFTTRGVLALGEEVAPRIVMYLENTPAELRDPSAGKVVIVQVESLHKLLELFADGQSSLRAFDYVICDEARSLMSQVVSEQTHRRHLQQNQVVLERLCLNARCILLDADCEWDGALSKFCLSDKGGLWQEHELEVHRYTFQTLPRTAKITFDRNKFQAGLQRALESAKAHRERTGESRPVVLNCMCKASLNTFVCRLFPEQTGLPGFGDNCVYSFTGDSNEGVDAFNDINNFIRTRAVDLIAHSPKITVGCSIEVPVTAVFCDATKKGCVVRDWGQGCGRSRVIDGDCLHVLMGKPRVGASYCDDELAEDIDKRLREREDRRLKELEFFYPEFDFVNAEEQDGPPVLHFKSSARAPEWVVNCITSSIIEKDRTTRNQPREVLRFFQFKGWPTEFVDILPDTPSGFFPVRPPVEKKLDQAATKRKAEIQSVRWQTAHERKRKLPYEQIMKAAVTDVDKWDKETAILHQYFPESRDVLTAAHGKWFSAHRAALFHSRTLTMGPEDIAHLDLTNMLFAFRKKRLMNATKIVESLEALDKLLAIVGVTKAQFVKADGKLELSRDLVQARLQVKDVRKLTNMIFGVLWSRRSDRMPGSGLALVRRVFKHYGRVLATKDRNTFTVLLDPDFAFLIERYVPRKIRVDAATE